MFLFTLFVFLLYPFSNGLNKTDIILGFLFPKYPIPLLDKVGFDLTGGVVPMAMDRIKELNLLNNLNFTYYVRFDECLESNATGTSLELFKETGVDVIFTSPCNMPGLRSTTMGKFLNKPTFAWGLVSTTAVTDYNMFPNIVSSVSVWQSLGHALIDVMQQFNWTRATFIFSTNLYGRCYDMYSEIMLATTLNAYQVSIVTALKLSDPPLDSEYDRFLSATKGNARIIIGCFDEDIYQRQFMLKMFDAGLSTNEYVFITVDYKRTGFYTNALDKNGNKLLFYQDSRNPPDGRDNDALVIAKKTLVLDLNGTGNGNTDYDKEVLARIKDFPFYCKSCNTSHSNISSIYSKTLYDSILLWAYLLNKTIPLYGDEVFNNALLYRQSCGDTYMGITGPMSFDSNCYRLPIIQLDGLDSNGSIQTYFNYSFINLSNFTRTSISLNNLDQTMFQNWGKTIPLNVPDCGYAENTCPVNILKDYFSQFIIVVVIVFVIIVIIVLTTIYIICLNVKKKVFEEMVWSIPYNFLEITSKSKAAITQSTFSVGSVKNDVANSLARLNHQETKRFIFLYYEGFSVSGEKHRLPVHVIFKEDKKEMVDLMKCEHSNLNKFFGMSLDGAKQLSIWKFCKRGNLYDILQTENSIFDSFFLMALVKGIANGLEYIHNHFDFHGQLTSKNVFLTDKWEVKLSNFNLKSHRYNEALSLRNKLWQAPEIIRADLSVSNQEGDIFSFAIICSEILTKLPPWNISNREESLEELIYLIKRGGVDPVRPSLVMSPNVEINPGMLALVKDCWVENPKNRPTILQVQKLIHAFSVKGSANLMDHVFQLLEEYSITLKDEVAQRSKELLVEQKKCDLLLSKMLPPEIAYKLKMGKAVPAEEFESITVMFTDIVKFTSIANSSTPLQLINFVNEIFTIFDNIIEMGDTYKVEAIADGYLVVSGLPKRNDDHSLKIIELALKLIEACNDYKISHLPNEKVSIRVGANTGSCVGSVVGLSMPRFCLFGDTVNTASRMESNGQMGKIHITQTCHDHLETFNRYDMESRGEILIKGKGLMETYFCSSKRRNTIF